MAKNLRRLISRLGFPLVSIAISAGTVSFVIGNPHGDTKQPSQVVQPSNNTTLVSEGSTAIKATTNGNRSPVNVQTRDGNIVGGDDKSTINNTTNSNPTHVNGPQINTQTYNENCRNAKIDRGSNCVNTGNVTNKF